MGQVENRKVALQHTDPKGIAEWEGAGRGRAPHGIQDQEFAAPCKPSILLASPSPGTEKGNLMARAGRWDTAQ